MPKGDASLLKFAAGLYDMESRRVYFPGLNGLRFIAALAVIFTHVELMKKFLGHASHWIILDERIRVVPYQEIANRNLSWLSPVIANTGPLGVVFFFVLSGFLITYLLLREKDAVGHISIRKFYLRRILRIWPLYYLVLIIGFFILPHFDWFNVPVQRRLLEPVFWQSFLLCLFMLPNMAFAMFPAAPPNIGQIWSIGVEEQFYLIWPWLIRRAKSVVRSIIIFMVVFIALKMLILALDHYTDYRAFQIARKFFAMSRLESMALGALGAWVLFEKKEYWLKIAYHPLIQVLSYILIPFLIFFTPIIFQNVIHLVYSVIFLVIILNISTNPKTLINLDFRGFDFLGRISFGLYMYHIMVIVFVLHALKNTIGLNRDLSASENLLVYSASITLTILISTLSYYLFERKFIRIKSGLSVIVSGDEARKE